MGLDVSHDAWSGAYSAFHRFRTRIAEVAGYSHQWEAGKFTIEDGEDASESGIYEGNWKKAPADAVLLLLLHSDCDGKIEPEHCRLLADRLEGLLPNLHGDGGGHLGDYRAKTEQFIKGLREAAEANEPLEFH